MNHDWQNVRDAAFSQWPAILSSIAGLSPKNLQNKHQPCPSCGGHDRYRFTDRGGNGEYYCNQCGAGDGMSLLLKVTGFEFSEAVNAVGEFLMLDPRDRDTVTHIRQPPPKPISERANNNINKEKAEAWLSRAKPIPLHEWTLKNVISVTGLIGTGVDRAVIVPINSNNGLVNAAAISSSGEIAFAAGGITYGGYSEIGKDSGRSVFICADWVDSWVTAKATNSLVYCAWSVFNLDDCAKAIMNLRQDKPVYFALNCDIDELACAEYAGIKCILPDQADYIHTSRKFKRALFSVSGVIDELQRNAGN